MAKEVPVYTHPADVIEGDGSIGLRSDDREPSIVELAAMRIVSQSIGTAAEEAALNIAANAPADESGPIVRSAAMRIVRST